MQETNYCSENIHTKKCRKSGWAAHIRREGRETTGTLNIPLHVTKRRALSRRLFVPVTLKRCIRKETRQDKASMCFIYMCSYYFLSNILPSVKTEPYTSISLHYQGQFYRSRHFSYTCSSVGDDLFIHVREKLYSQQSG